MSDQTPAQARAFALAALYSACSASLIAMGHEGANADVHHPLRKAWEACRDAETRAVESGLLTFCTKPDKLA